MRYANAKVCPPRPGEKTYRVRGTKEPFYTFNVIEGAMSTSEGARRCKKIQRLRDRVSGNRAPLYALLQKQQNEWHIRLHPVKNRHAGQLTEILPIKDASKLYYDGLPFHRSPPR